MLAAFSSAFALGSLPPLRSMSDAGILYSPYNWKISAGGSATTINPGAYFKTIYSGQSVVLHANTTALVAMGSQFWTRTDRGPLIQHVLTAGETDATFNISAGPPFSASPKHIIEVIIKSTTETENRWDSNVASTAVVFTGIELDAIGAAAPLELPRRKPFNVLIYGDSITEGVRTMGFVDIANDTDRNDAVRDYSFHLSQLLPIEIGVVAFGATGTTKGGSGGVPDLTKSWNQLWDGEPRDFTTHTPNLVIYNEGTNDSKNTTASLLEVVAAIQKIAPKTKQLVMLPFNGGHEVDIKAVVAAMQSQVVAPGAVVFGDTTGFYPAADAALDGLHPFGYAHVGHIAPQIAELCNPLLF